MRILWLEIRRSPLRWWLPFLIAVDVLVLFGRSSFWQGEWPATSVQAQIPAFYLGPFAAAAAAWVGGRTFRTRTEDLTGTTALPPLVPRAIQLATALIYTLGAYIVCVGVAAVTSLVHPHHAAGFLWFGYVSLGFFLIVGLTAAGHIVGVFASSTYVAPAAAAVVSLGVLLWFSSGAGLTVLGGSPDQKVASGALAVRGLCALLFLGFAVVAPMVSIPKRYLPAGAVALIVPGLVISGVAIHSAGPIQVQRKPTTSSATCTNGKPVICLWKEDAPLLSGFTAMGGRMQQLPAFFTIPDRLDQQGLTADANGPNSFFVLEGSLWDPAESLAGAVLNASKPQQCGTTGSPVHASPEDYVQSGELSMWLAMRIFGGPRPTDMHGEPPGVDMNKVASVLSEPEAAQDAWAKTRLDTIHKAFC